MSSADPSTTASQGATIVYDGECPFCASYVRVIRLREALGNVRLQDARQGGPAVKSALARGYDLDKGMVLILNGRYYYGSECMHRLALLSTGHGWFNRINAMIFRSAVASRALYPVLRSGRSILLFLLGRRRIGTVGRNDNGVQ